ncbi:hypothetical protein [Actinomadura gamaensis]|uniref:Uncharacterized protein n=1 Tax=Actinomadura gamaensis TaxID=1763541 RepID=A0ABV9TXB4_9ACTN
MATEPNAYEARWRTVCAELDAHPEISVRYRNDGDLDARFADPDAAWTALTTPDTAPDTTSSTAPDTTSSTAPDSTSDTTSSTAPDSTSDTAHGAGSADASGEITAPAGLADCFVRFRGLGRQWTTTEPGVGGEFFLTSLAHAKPQAYDSWIDPWEGGKRFPSAELRIIDEHPVTGTGNFAGIRLRPGGGEPELWWSTIRYADWRLDIGYREYLDTLLLTRGAFGWQFLFTRAPLATEEFDLVRARLERTLDALPGLFPEDDYTHLKRRFEERL